MIFHFFLFYRTIWRNFSFSIIIWIHLSLAVVSWIEFSLAIITWINSLSQWHIDTFLFLQNTIHISLSINITHWSVSPIKSAWSYSDLYTQKGMPITSFHFIQILILCKILSWRDKRQQKPKRPHWEGSNQQHMTYEFHKNYMVWFDLGCLTLKVLVATIVALGHFETA